MRVAIEAYLKNVSEGLKKDQRAKGIYSSGRSANSLRVQTSEKSGQLMGSNYFAQQTAGRAPGKFPPIESIIEWIKVKNIQKRDNISDRSLAFIIARKIAQKGTDIHEGKRPALDLKGISEKALPELMKSITEEKVLQIVTPLRRLKQ